VLLPKWYWAFGLTAAFMTASTDLLSQPSDMSSVQPPLLHFVKLVCPSDLIDLSNDSFEGAIPNVSLKTPAACTLISDFKYSEHSKSIFIPIGSSSHSNFSYPPILKSVPGSQYHIVP
jgi:hypothetical protein